MSILKLLSYLGLALTLLPCFFLYGGVIEAGTSKGIMAIGMILWFGSAVFWIKPDHTED